MPEFDQLNSYIDQAALEKDTAFFLGLLDKVESSALGVASKIQNAFSTVTDGGSVQKQTTKDTIDGIKNLEITTASYQKVLTQVAYEVDNLTDAQKTNLKAINDEYRSQELARAGAKETVNLIKTEIAQQQKKAASMEGLAETIARNRSEQTALNREQKLSANLYNEERNSLGRAQALILQYTNAKKKLNLSTEEGTRLNDNYNKAIQKANEFILKNADAETKRTKNIGNYSQSAQIIVDALEKERKKLEELKVAREEASQAQNQRSSGSKISGVSFPGSFASSVSTTDTSAITAYNKEIDESAKKVEALQKITDQPIFAKTAASAGDARKELAFFSKQLIELQRNGLGNTSAADDLKEHLAELKKEIKSTDAELKALASDHKGIDTFVESVNFAADAFELAAGTAVLFGASEEDAAESIKTLVAIQSISNGIKGVATELTTKGTAANKLYSFSQLQIKTAFDVTATSAARLRAALITVGIGALIVGVGLLIANFDKLKRGISGVSEEQESATKVSQKAIESFIDEKTKVSLLVTEYQDLGTSTKRRKEIQDELQKDYPNYFKNLKTEKDFAEGLTGAYNKLSIALLAKAKSQAASSLIAENEGKALKYELETQQELERLFNVKDVNNLPEGKFKGVAESFLARRKKEADAIRSSSDYLIKTIIDSNKKIDELGGDPNDTETSKKEDDTEKKRAEAAKKASEKAKLAAEKAFQERQELLKRDADAENKIIIQQVNDRIQANQEIVDSDKSTFSEQLIAIDKLNSDKKLLAAKELADAIGDTEKIENGKIIKIKKTNKEIELAELLHKNAVVAIEKDSIKARDAAQKDHFDRAQAEVDKQKKLELDTLEDQYDKIRSKEETNFDDEQAALNRKYAAGKISQEKYNKETEALQVKHNLQSLNNELDYQEKVLKASNLTTEEIRKALEKIAALRREISAAGVKNAKDDETEIQDAVTKTLDTIQKSSEIVFSTIGGLLDASATKQKNKNQAERDEIEKTTAAEIDAVNASTDSAEEKAAKIAIINAKAQAKKEELARKDREIEIQRLRFEKSAAIFSIILNTALAIVKAKDPLSKILAAVSGAAQLAVAIATPIPRFKDGLDEDYEGWAITGDGGKREAHIKKDGTVSLTPNRDTLTWINKGDRIHPDADSFLYDMQRQAMAEVAGTANAPITVNHYGEAMAKAMEKQIKAMERVQSAIENKRENHLSVKDGALVSLWKYGANTTKYFLENTNWI